MASTFFLEIEIVTTLSQPKQSIQKVSNLSSACVDDERTLVGESNVLKKSVLSFLRLVKSGVPQGSILGPVLLICF